MWLEFLDWAVNILDILNLFFQNGFTLKRFICFLVVILIVLAIIAYVLFWD